MFSHDGGLVFSGGNDRSVKVWDRRNSEHPLHTIRCSSVPMRFDLSKNSNMLAIPLQDRKAKLCNVQGNSLGIIGTKGFTFYLFYLI